MKAFKKIACAVLCAAFVLSLCPAAFAADTNVTKDESVYTILNADGSVKEESVSCWLHSDSGLTGVADKSSLSNITNLKSSVEPKVSGGAVAWDTADHDVYYNGTTDKTPPVSVSITYTLAGQPIKAEDLIGKSGDITITYTFTNNDKQTKLIGGENRTVYTPFAVGLVMDLPNKHFADVSAGSGSVLTDSANQIVDYVCLPGVKENFDGILADGDLTGLQDVLSGTFTVTAKTADFEMPAVVIAAATKLSDLNKLNLNDKLTELTGGLGKLGTAVEQLKDGTAQLSAALGEYDSKISTLGKGYSSFDDSLLKAAAGASELKKGTAQLSDAASLLKQEVTSQLIPGITASASQQQALVEKMTALQTQLSALNLPDMSGIETQLTTAISSVCDASSNATIQVLTGGKTYGDLTEAQQIAIAAAKKTIEVQAGTQLAKMLSGLDTKSLTALTASLKDIETLSTNLMSSMNTLTKSLYDPNDSPSNPKTLSNAIIALSVGADKVNAVASRLDSGFGQLSKSSAQIKTGLQALIGASDQLAEKSGELSGGVTTFMSGVDKLTGNGMQKKLSQALDIKDEMLRQADEYASFSGAPDGAKTSIRFIMKTGDVTPSGAQNAAKAGTQNSQTVKKTFWQRVGDFFKNIF